MWGDYHARELSLMLLREARGESYMTFFDKNLQMHSYNIFSSISP